MTVNQAFRYELQPTARQRRFLASAAGTARSAYNWGLAGCKRRLDAGKPVPPAAEMPRLWNADQPGRSWGYGVSKCCGQEAWRDVDRAFANFWRGRKAGRPVGFPRFRRKHGRRDAFRLTGSIKVRPRSVTLPRVGGVRTKEATEKFRGRILSATVRREADRGYVSRAVEVEREDPQPVEGPVVGVALGLKSFAVISDGTRIASPKPLTQAPRRLRPRQRLHSRKPRGSRNRRKSAAGLARLHRRMRCRRADFLHKATTDLAKTKSVIVVEALFVQGMIRNHSLARSIADAGWSAFRRMLAYKTRWYGSQLVVGPRFYPSTQTCAACGCVQAALSLGERVFRCAACGAEIDRDLHAARNLAALVAGSSPETQNACGGDGAGRENGPAKLAPVKQEASSGQPASPRTRGNKRL